MRILNSSSRLLWQSWTWHFCQVWKTEQNCCCPHCRCHHFGYSVPPAHHRTIWCRSTFGPRAPGLSNPTSFLRPALPMAPTTDNNARDKRSVPHPNPAAFLRDFMLYMTTKYAIIRKRCLNYTAWLTVIRRVFPFGNMVKKRFAKKIAAGKRLMSFPGFRGRFFLMKKSWLNVVEEDCNEIDIPDQIVRTTARDNHEKKVCCKCLSLWNNP